MKTFTKSFTQQEPVSEEAIEKAVEVLRSGRLHRYNVAPGEDGEAAALEAEFAAYLGVPYCLACTSGGYAIQLALRAVGTEPGQPVLSNAFTLSPVPGAIAAAGGRPVLVETTPELVIDLAHLDRQAAASGARLLLLSHMRGHICDMEAVLEVCARRGLTLIEDCAHTMGATWKGRKSGSFGTAACFSTQTYKHMNSGEGGLLTTGDAQVMARAVLLSGSYMLYARHGAAPDEAAFEEARYLTPNMSGRMDNLRAAILRPQLAGLDENCRRWNARYRALEDGLRRAPGVRICERPAEEGYVGSSIQFALPGLDEAGIRDFVARCLARGVEVKWFGAAEPQGYTSRYDSWRYIEELPDLPGTRAVLATLCDLRVPLTFAPEDCALIAEIIGEVLAGMGAGAP